MTYTCGSIKVFQMHYIKLPMYIVGIVQYSNILAVWMHKGLSAPMC